MNKLPIIILQFSLLFCYSFFAIAQHQHQETATTKADTTKKSIKKETHAMIGENHFTVHYHSPAVRGRVIYGGLVAYDQVWVTGAHKATSVEFTKNVIINGQKLAAGKYAFFTIPSKKKWIVIFNKKWEQHLADDYDAKDDVLRFEVKPKKLSNNVERLQYEITEKDAKSGDFVMSWEKLQLKFTIENE